MEKETNHLEGIKLVSFDIWQTLLKSHPQYKNERALAITKILCLKSIPVEDMLEVIKEADDALDVQTENDGVQYGLGDRLEAIYRLLDPKIRIKEFTQETIDQFDNVSLELLEEYLPIIIEPDLLDTLQKIKSMGIEMAVISNTGFIEGKHMRVALEKLGILPYMRIQIFSNEIGVAKPNRKIFDAIVAETGYLPNEILHIGDNHLADFVGANDAGVKALHLTKEQNTNTKKIEHLRDLTR